MALAPPASRPARPSLLGPIDLMYRGRSHRATRRPPQRATEPIYPARNPYLNGVFAPVDGGLDVADLPVIEKIPEDLRSAYLRNGPNVKFPPLQLWIPLTRE